MAGPDDQLAALASDLGGEELYDPLANEDEDSNLAEHLGYFGADKISD